MLFNMIKSVQAAVMLLVILFSLDKAFADDMRPAALNVKALPNNEFNVVFKVPANGDKVIKLALIFDEYTENLPAKQASKSKDALSEKSAKKENDSLTSDYGYFASDSYIRSWQIQRNKAVLPLSIFIDGLTDNSVEVLVRFEDFQGGVSTKLLNVDNRQYTLPTNAKPANGVFGSYLIYGFEHILIGVDHLLFVLCLLFITRNLRTLFYTITGFTLAHSLTLILAAKGLFVLPILPVEAVIALSIIYLSLEIAKNNTRSITLRYPIVASSSFGLLHGFGFASVLADIGLPKDETLQALIAFNIGVELGQLSFVVCIVSLYLLMNKLLFNVTKDKLRYMVSYGCGITATFWLIQRLLAF
jgi:hydrogenase/urease accessory protein HupE